MGRPVWASKDKGTLERGMNPVGGRRKQKIQFTVNAKAPDYYRAEKKEGIWESRYLSNGRGGQTGGGDRLLHQP